MRPQGFPEADSYPRAMWDVVGPMYFTAMGIPLVTGRDFSDRDTESSPRVIAINETMARRLFAGTNPIGRRLVWGDGEKQTDFEIIAVARDVKQGSPRDEPHLREGPADVAEPAAAEPCRRERLEPRQPERDAELHIRGSGDTGQDREIWEMPIKVHEIFGHEQRQYLGTYANLIRGTPLCQNYRKLEL